MNENVKMYFDHHPKVDTFYFTKDGQAFTKETDAHNHATRLLKKNKANGGVLVVTRQQCDEWYAHYAKSAAVNAEADLANLQSALERDVRAAQDAPDGVEKRKAERRVKVSGAILDAAKSAHEKAIGDLAALEPAEGDNSDGADGEQKLQEAVATEAGIADPAPAESEPTPVSGSVTASTTETMPANGEGQTAPKAAMYGKKRKK